MDKNKLTKTDLWAERLQDFQKSRLSQKEWCREHQIPVSTLGYWLRKQTRESAGQEKTADPMFVRLPSEQEIAASLLPDHAAVTIYLPGNVRIEIGIECPCELMVSLLHTLKTYA